MSMALQDNYPVRSILISPEVKNLLSDEEIARYPDLGPNPNEPDVVRTAREALALRFGESGYWLYFGYQEEVERLLVGGLSFVAEGASNFYTIADQEGPIKPLKVAVTHIALVQ